ncbi:MAG: tRNA (guanosine(37)-N1)-methyltransferase TrmD, partial [Oscillospiraceae bacterium]|nr:tRNA (guanosine(37)-N1)-methyltransferase TrmD [Oscillospiraceae bacterium]
VRAVLLYGHHETVRKWRRKQSILLTRPRRPDLSEKLDLSSKEDQQLLKEIEELHDPEKI